MKKNIVLAIAVFVALFLIAVSIAPLLRILQDDIWVDPSKSMSPSPARGATNPEFPGYLGDSFLPPARSGCDGDTGDRCDYVLCTGPWHPFGEKLKKISYTLASGPPGSEYPLFLIELETIGIDTNDPYVDVRIQKEIYDGSPLQPVSLNCCNEHAKDLTCAGSLLCSGSGLPLEMYFPHQEGTPIEVVKQDGTTLNTTVPAELPKWGLKHDDGCWW